MNAAGDASLIKSCALWLFSVRLEELGAQTRWYWLYTPFEKGACESNFLKLFN